MTDAWQAELIKQAVSAAFTVGGKGADFLWGKLKNRDPKKLREDPQALEAAVRELVTSDPDAAAALAELVNVRLLTSGTRPKIAASFPFFVDRVGAWSRLGGTGVRVLSGPRTIGKTTLAEHFGQRSAGTFPDGQLCVDLAGYRDGPGTPLRRGQIRASVLRRLGMGEGLIARSGDELAEQYEQALTPLRLLLVFDSVEGVEDLRGLVPPAPMSLVLALTEKPSDELLLQYPAHVPLTRLEEGADRQLLEWICGQVAVGAEPGAVRAVLEHCDGLPAAVVAAANLARVRAPLGPRPFEIVEAELRAGAALGPVSAAFDRALAELPVGAAELCAALTAFPGRDFTIEAAVAAAGRPLPEVTPLLAQLQAVALVAPAQDSRLKLGNQARQAVLRASVPVDEDQVFTRLLDFYRTRAVQADHVVMGEHRLRLYPELEPGAPPSRLGKQESLSWLVAELATYRTLVRRAHELGRHTEVAQICGALEIVVLHRGYLREYVDINHWGIASADAGNDTALLTRTVSQQGRVLAMLHEFPLARKQFERTDALLSTLGTTPDDRKLTASVWEFRGLFHRQQDEFVDAARCYGSALDISRSLGGQPSRGLGLHARMLANVLVSLGHYRDSLELLAEAEAHTLSGFDRDLAQVWLVRAKALTALGQGSQALALLPEVWRLAAGGGSDQYDLEIAEALGDAAWNCGAAELARQHWSGVWQRLDAAKHPRAAKLYAKLMGGLSR